MTAPIERMKKILELARRGVGGEAKTAEAMLQTLLKKYNMTREDLEGEAPAKRFVTLTYRGPHERRLLIQIVGFVTGVSSVRFNEHRVKSELTFEVTALEYAEIDTRFSAYRPALAEALDRALVAFIHTNELGGKADPSKAPPPDPDELAALLAMMRAMSPTPVRSQLGMSDDESSGL